MNDNTKPLMHQEFHFAKKHELCIARQHEKIYLPAMTNILSDQIYLHVQGRQRKSQSMLKTFTKT